MPRRAIGDLLIPRGAVSEFALCSGDRNPLHTSDAYARRSPMAGIVVHGVLAVLAALALQGKAHNEITRLKADFHSPVLPDLHYTVKSVDSPHVETLWICDGHRRLVTIEIAREGGSGRPLERFRDCAPEFPLSEARHGVAGNRPDTQDPGRYWPDLDRLRRLVASFAAEELDCSDWLLVALCCSTYIVGMEMPGRTALLRALNVERSQGAWIGAPVTYVMEPVSASALRRGIAKVCITGMGHAEQVFSATASVFVRKEWEPGVGTVPWSVARRAKVLAGRTAVVTGGSRGFGLALSALLVSYGCRVLSIQRSAIEPSVEAALGDSFVVYQTDVADLDRLASLSDELMAGGVTLDFLFINATGPLVSLWLDRAHGQRMIDYATKEIRMILAPLVCLLPNLERSGGMCVYVSSEGLSEDAKESGSQVWHELPHYRAVKAAGETLVASVAAQYPGVAVDIWRLPPMDTTLAFRATGQEGSSPMAVAEEALRGVVADATARWSNASFHG